MRKKFSLLEHFLLHFNALKDAASDEPSRLKTFYGQHEHLTTLVKELYEFMVISDFDRRVFHSPKKYHMQTPPSFQDAYKDYTENWKVPIKRAIFPPIRLSDNVSLSDKGMAEDDAWIADEDARYISAPEIVSPDPDIENRFDPLSHDGGEAFEMAFWGAECCVDVINENSSDDEVALRNRAKIGLARISQMNPWFDDEEA